MVGHIPSVYQYHLPACLFRVIVPSCRIIHPIFPGVICIQCYPITCLYPFIATIPITVFIPGIVFIPITCLIRLKYHLSTCHTLKVVLNSHYFDCHSLWILWRTVPEKFSFSKISRPNRNWKPLSTIKIRGKTFFF